MKRRTPKDTVSRVFFCITLSFCALLIAAAVLLAVRHGKNDVRSFLEPVLAMEDGWSLTDSDGNSREIRLPETIDCGIDGCFTLAATLPEVQGALTSPAFAFYSNYVDVRIAVGGHELYAFPTAPAAFSGATGNTYHFVRLPADYAGQTVTVTIRCQLGDGITYLLKAPQLGSKATMLKDEVLRSIPAFMLAGCLTVLAVGLGALYVAFRRQFDMNRATLYTAVFTLLFGFYICCETSLAQILLPNGYLLCYLTLTLLSLIPIPLLGIFLDVVSKKFKPLMYGLMSLCAANLVVQSALNFTGTASVRTMLPVTHIVILLTIAAASLCLLFSDRVEKPGARRVLLSAVPMIAGGLADIVLLALERPSINNSFWFVLGVTVFIVHQLCGYLSGYFALYRAALGTKLLTSMAYRDTLSGIDNRNAYERKLKSLCSTAPSPALCCIVMDINDLKWINDTLGHQAGDTAISTVGAVLRERMPTCASFFRTGGDEFVVLLEGYDEPRTQELAERLADEANRRGVLHAVPINLAVGFGQYDDDDGGILDFIRRVDSLMYECKRKQKSDKRTPPA